MINLIKDVITSISIGSAHRSSLLSMNKIMLLNLSKNKFSIRIYSLCLPLIKLEEFLQ